MALATDSTQGTVKLTGDIQGSSDSLAPELTPTGVAAGTYVFPNLVVDQKGRVLYADEGFDVPCASDTNCGYVIPGENISFNPVNSEISIPVADNVGTLGVITYGVGFNLTGDVLSLDYPIATTTVAGVVKVGQGVTVDINGNLELVLAGNAPTGPLGGIRLGAGLVYNGVTGSVDVDLTELNLRQTDEGIEGVMQPGTGLSVSTAGTVDVNTNELFANTSTSGFVAVPESGHINIDGSGNISVPNATSVDVGVCKGDEVDVTVLAGVISVASPPAPTADATTSSKGVMQIGLHLNDTGGAGIIGVDKASSNTTYGVVRSADTNNITITTGEIDVGSNVVQLDTAQSFLAGQTISSSILTAGTVTPDFSLSNVFILTLTSNTIINAPTNATDGQCVTFIIKQASGSRTVTFDSVYKFDTVPTITSTANAVDVVNIVRLSSTEYISQHITNFS